MFNLRTNLYVTVGVWIFLVCIQGILSDCTNEKLDKKWKENEKEYPELMELFRNRTGGELDSGSKILKFINWQDKVFRLECPGTSNNENDKVKEWKHNYFSNPKNEKTEEKSIEFAKEKHNSWQLVIEPPISLEYFSTYSCQTLDECWHHYYVVVQPAPRTTFPVHIQTGSNGSFSCWSRSRVLENGSEEFLINAPLRSMTWKFPRNEKPANAEVETKKRVLNGVESIWESMIVITQATDLNAGIHECIIADRFGVKSSPELDGVYLRSGERYRGAADVHVRPLEYTFIPLGIIAAQILLIPILVKCLPVAKDEADLEEEDPKPMLQRLISSGSANVKTDLDLAKPQ